MQRVVIGVALVVLAACGDLTVTIQVDGGGPPYVSTPDPAATRGLWGSLRIASPTRALNGGPNVDWFGHPVYVFKPREVQYDEYAITLAEWRR